MRESLDRDRRNRLHAALDYVPGARGLRALRRSDLRYLPKTRTYTWRSDGQDGILVLDGGELRGRPSTTP